MKPRLPPAEPIVETITISEVLMRVAVQKKKAKKNRAAMVGPSSMTPNDSVRYECIAHRAMARRDPVTTARVVTPERRGTGREAARGDDAALRSFTAETLIELSTVAKADAGGQPVPFATRD